MKIIKTTATSNKEGENDNNLNASVKLEQKLVVSDIFFIGSDQRNYLTVTSIHEYPSAAELSVEFFL